MNTTTDEVLKEINTLIAANQNPTAAVGTVEYNEAVSVFYTATAVRQSVNKMLEAVKESGSYCFCGDSAVLDIFKQAVLEAAINAIKALTPTGKGWKAVECFADDNGLTVRVGDYVAYMTDHAVEESSGADEYSEAVTVTLPSMQYGKVTAIEQAVGITALRHTHCNESLRVRIDNQIWLLGDEDYGMFDKVLKMANE